MKSAPELHKLLINSRAGDDIIAYRGSTLFSWNDFKSSCEAYIEEYSKIPLGSWALFNSDAFEFACQLIALWHLGNTVYLAADNLPMSRMRLEKKVTGFIGEFEGYEYSHDVSNTSPVSQSRTPVDNEAISMVIFTSGSSGEPSEVPVCLRQLDAEAATLEAQFGDRLHHCRFASTVSHQHLYGFMFSLLWPLLYRRQFPCQRINYIEELPNVYRNNQPTALISTPSHLSRLPPNIDRQALQAATQLVFSSTAPLTQNDSDATGRYFDANVIEIYGSSETGAIAWRNQAEQEHWNALPNIEIEESEQRLRIKSPHSFESGWQFGNDRINILGKGQFDLIGRIDRIAKVEGVRVSLNAMEARIESHKSVSRSKVISINETGGLGAVVELEPTENQELDIKTRRELKRQIRAILLYEFSLPTLPKKWRFIHELPEDSQGKVRIDDLKALFPRKNQE